MKTRTYRLTLVALLLRLSLAASRATHIDDLTSLNLTTASARVISLECGVPFLRHWETIDKLELTFTPFGNGFGTTTLLGGIMFDNFIRRGELPPWARLSGNMSMKDPESCSLRLTMPLTHENGKYVCTVFYTDHQDTLANVSAAVSVSEKFKSKAVKNFLVTVDEGHEILVAWYQKFGTEITEVNVRRTTLSETGTDLSRMTLYTNDSKGNNRYDSEDVILSALNKTSSTIEQDHYQLFLYVTRGSCSIKYKYEAWVSTAHGTGHEVQYVPPLLQTAHGGTIINEVPVIILIVLLAVETIIIIILALLVHKVIQQLRPRWCRRQNKKETSTEDEDNLMEVHLKQDEGNSIRQDADSKLCPRPLHDDSDDDDDKSLHQQSCGDSNDLTRNVKLRTACTDRSENRHNLSSAYTDRSENRHNLSSAGTDRSENRHNLSSAYTDRSENRHNLSSAGTDRSENRHNLSSACTDRSENRHNLSSAGTDRSENRHNLSSAGTDRSENRHNLSSACTDRSENRHNLSSEECVGGPHSATSRVLMSSDELPDEFNHVLSNDNANSDAHLSVKDLNRHTCTAPETSTTVADFIDIKQSKLAPEGSALKNKILTN